MLGGELIRDLNRLIEARDAKEPAVLIESLPDELGASPVWDLSVDGFLDIRNELLGGREQYNTFVAGSVLRLGNEIGRDPIGIGGCVRNDQHFAGPGEEIDGDVSKQGALGGHDIGIAGSEDLIDGTNCFGPQGHCGDRLRTADRVNLGSSCLLEGIQQILIDLSLRVAGSANHDLGASGDLGERDCHERGGNERGRSSGDVESNTLERVELLSDLGVMRVLGLPGLAHRLLTEIANIPGGGFDGLGDLFPAGTGVFQGLVGNLKRFRAEGGSIEFAGILDEGLVAVLFDAVDNGLSAFDDRLIKEAGGAEELANRFFEALLVVGM